MAGKPFTGANTSGTCRCVLFTNAYFLYHQAYSVGSYRKCCRTIPNKKQTVQVCDATADSQRFFAWPRVKKKCKKNHSCILYISTEFLCSLAISHPAFLYAFIACLLSVLTESVSLLTLRSNASCSNCLISNSNIPLPL